MSVLRPIGALFLAAASRLRLSSSHYVDFGANATPLPLISLALLLEAARPLAMQPILPCCFSIRLNCLSVSPVTQRISSLSIIYHDFYLTMLLFVVFAAAVAVAIVTQIELGRRAINGYRHRHRRRHRRHYRCSSTHSYSYL